jgi:hypothetical protein
VDNTVSRNGGEHGWGAWLAALASSAPARTTTSSPAVASKTSFSISASPAVASKATTIEVASKATAVTCAARVAQSRVVRWVATAAVLVAALAAGVASPGRVHAGDIGEAPATLAETGLYRDWSTKTLAPGLIPFEPQYPLWTDGASKRRWISLPGAIDARDADAWVFPVGTRVWKEFSFGARTETRYMERTAEGWRYATYVWRGDAAVRAPREGVRVAVQGGTHQVPSESDCRACHANGPTPVLAFAALQLSSDRDPNALHRGSGGIDLVGLAASGFAYGITDVAPRIAGNPTQRAALGYLHGNCGSCHRASGPLANLDMEFAQPASGVSPTLRTTAKVKARIASDKVRIVPGSAGTSFVIKRMSERRSPVQMPPLGTDKVDAEALRLIADWIDQLAPNS